MKCVALQEKCYVVNGNYREKRAPDIVQKVYYSTTPRRGGEYCCVYTETRLL